MIRSTSLGVVLCLLSLVCSLHAANEGFMTLRGTSEYSMDSISEIYVADLISHVAGLAPVHQEANRSQFPSTSLFSAPAANVLIAIDAVTPELLNQAQTKFLNLENDETVSITKASYPEDGLSTLTTLLTGEDYTQHGIIGHSWAASKGVSVEAYTPTGNCKALKLVDNVAASSEGGARIISVSANKKMALAMSVNTELAQLNPEWNNDVLFYSKKNGLVDLNSQVTIKNFEDIEDFGRKNSMTLKTAEGYMLASELHAMAIIPDRLKLMARADNVEAPDMINIGISSVKALTLRYGAGSPQVLDALRLIDETLVTLFERLESRYEGSIVTEIVGLQGSAEEHTFYTQTKQQVAHQVMDDTSDDSDTYTQDEVSAFQTQLWVGVAFVIAIVLGTLALVKMDKLEDSLIYRTTDGPRPIPNVS